MTPSILKLPQDDRTLPLASNDRQPMHIEKITFDRVFDIQRWAASRYSPQRTHFSFEAAGKKRYSVQVPGWPTISAGDTVTAVLEEEGNWQTLAGWKNHSTGEVVLPEAGLSLVGCLTGALLGALFLFVFNSAQSSAGRWVAGSVIGLVCLMLLDLFFQWRRQKKLSKVIRRADARELWIDADPSS